MKKVFLALSLSLAVALTTSAHPVEKENPRVEKAFQKMFAGASHVNWAQVKEGLLKVSFVWGGHQSIAVFDTNAQLIGTIRGLFFRDLPLPVAKAVTEQFNNPVALEVNEIFNEEGLRYAVVLEDKNKKYNVSLDSRGNVVEKERIKK